MAKQKIFFSYSRFDSAFALQLAKDLRDSGADIWIDQLDIPAGNHWDAEVESALDSSACVLVILSPSSTSSANLMDEFSFALETGKKIIPVLYVNCLTPFRLRRLQRVDFTGDYGKGFNQLIQSLNLTIDDLAKKDILARDSKKIESVSNSEVSLSGRNASENRDNNLWEAACEENTIASYKQYQDNSLSGEYKAEARLQIKQLELEKKEDELESLLWQKAKSKNSKNLYQHYLHEYPNGNYKTLAIASIADLDKAEKLEQKKGSVEKAEKTTPQASVPGRKRKRSLAIIAGILIFCVGLVGFMNLGSGDEDHDAWSAALAKNDSTAFMFYRQKFPKGDHSLQAKQKVDSLNRVQQTMLASLVALEAPEIIMDSIIKTPVPAKIDSASKKSVVTKPKVIPAPKSLPKFIMGEHHQGGLVVYVNSTGEHGLIVATKELGSFSWDAAIKKCAGYKVEGYSDWRLPTRDRQRQFIGVQQKKILPSPGCIILSMANRVTAINIITPCSDSQEFLISLLH